MEKLITYCGQQAKVGCDEKCNKAWGINDRPRVYMDISEDKIFGANGTDIHPENEPKGFDCDEYAYCSDDELGNAPIEPQSWEGFECDGKPKNDSEKMNKWCVRECERCVMSDVGKWKEPLELKDFSKRFYNSFPHTR